MTTTEALEPRPLRRDAERNRQRILAAAVEVFADRGLAATLDDVAHHAGLGVGTVYRRFADKDALVEALFEERIRDLVGLAETACATTDPWEGLVGYLEAASARMAADRGLRDALLSPRHGQVGVTLARAELGPRVDRLTARCRDAGVLRPDVAGTDVATLLHAVQAAAEIGGTASPQHWRRTLGVLLDGLRPARTGHQPLPGAPLSDEELHEALTLGRRRAGGR
ncbi:TetR/AcrR family transcriptional regulator [Kineococcus sp. SYSU DK002]|uniref:TetR/AcrR family transcriptional regulator n=1 Tax=Kineococcus sp. SYSU DK002 TaxID=3383123 RepID=UPI003D7E963B